MAEAVEMASSQGPGLTGTLIGGRSIQWAVFPGVEGPSFTLTGTQKRLAQTGALRTLIWCPGAPFFLAHFATPWKHSCLGQTKARDY